MLRPKHQPTELFGKPTCEGQEGLDISARAARHHKHLKAVQAWNGTVWAHRWAVLLRKLLGEAQASLSALEVRDKATAVQPYPSLDSRIFESSVDILVSTHGKTTNVIVHQ